MMHWIHKYVLRHEVTHRRCTVPVWDSTSRGDLFRCACGRRWAR